MTVNRHRARAASTAAAALAISLAAGASAPETAAAPSPAISAIPPPVNGEMGFVVTHFGLTSGSDKEDCPDGLAGMLRENLLEALPADEQERLKKPENARELQRRISDYVSGPDGSDICTHFDRFDRPPQKMVQGRIAKGFNLDGDESGKAAGICAHGNFTSPTGEKGIDNQVWRAMGCLSRFRSYDGRLPDFAELFDTSLTTGENAQLILLRGVDSLVRDDNVEIIYANSSDRAIRDSKGRFIPGASYLIGDGQRGMPKRNVLKGRIVNAMLEAETPRVQLRQATPGSTLTRDLDLRAPRGKFDLRRVRLRIVFLADGTAKGLVGGYQPVHEILTGQSSAGRVAATNAFWDCTAIYAALKRSADGDPDPKTGQCATISTGDEFNAVRAFVIDPLDVPGEPR